MRLRWKFSFILALCVLLSVGTTTFVMTRVFSSDQESYLQDFQSMVSLNSESQLESRLNLLYSETGALLPDLRRGHIRLLSNIPGALNAEFWRRGRLVASLHPTRSASALPPPGNTQWGLTVSRFPAAVRWIGRFGSSVLAIDLPSGWFDGILEDTHGSRAALVTSDGIALLHSGKHAPLVFPRSFLSTSAASQSATPLTRYFEAGVSGYLGTLVPLPASPPLFIVVATPSSSVRAVIARTIRQSLWIACVFLILFVAAGISFSATLTSPLQKLVAQTAEVAKGRFESRVEVSERRRDEVGLLSRSFNRMGQELQKSREELRRSERLATLGMFSSAIAHEIKNPLGGILGNAQIAKRKLGSRQFEGSETALQALQFVEEETLRANKIIGQLMKFTRKDRAPSIQIDIASCLKRSLQVMAAELAENGITTVDEISQEPLLCLAHSDEVHEVMLNLVQNAIHAMKDSTIKRLRVSAGQKDDLIEIEIQDSGYGMDEETRNHLFEPFFTTKGIGQGTGLGLAVCHGIVLNHRGRIDVESSPGNGAIFRIHLPARR